MPTKSMSEPGAANPFQVTEKLMQTIRMPRVLVTFLRGEADRSGRNLTSCVNRHLDGLRSWFDLPAAASAVLEADRQALKPVLLHLLFQRALEIREKGPGFDASGAERKEWRPS